ncbi:hypothetical protein ATO8_18090 [Roseivivax marinus]|uniref:Uncharacterized protein n=2 Tax=Roseivivax marinus TaxID=1379903 RepID=W4HGW2_9RHOB|nr:hypothetical protein ATO8_18090 [Roseivivax marinus]
MCTEMNVTIDMMLPAPDEIFAAGSYTAEFRCEIDPEQRSATLYVEDAMPSERTGGYEHSVRVFEEDEMLIDAAGLKSAEKKVRSMVAEYCNAVASGANELELVRIRAMIERAMATSGWVCERSLIQDMEDLAQDNRLSLEVYVEADTPDAELEMLAEQQINELTRPCADRDQMTRLIISEFAKIRSAMQEEEARGFLGAKQ